MSPRQKQRDPLKEIGHAAVNICGKENWKNRSVFIGDCLDVMRQMNSGSVHLIYLDPPFNKKKQFQFPIGRAPAGADGETVGFKDFWSWRDIHSYEADELEKHYPAAARVVHTARLTYDKSMAAYCLMMASRIIEMRRILKPTGSIYLHCDPTASHYLKLLLDAIFGKANFRNEIVWCYSGGGVPKRDYPRKHDVIFRYAKSKEWAFHVERKPYKENTQQVGKHSTYSGGEEIDLARGTPVTDWWTDIKTPTGWSPERVSYPTQKPRKLLERIIKASSDKDDIILDPFCGCATTLLAAEILDRQYCGIDISSMAGKLLKTRLGEATSQGIIGKGIAPVTSILNARPVRSDLQKEMSAKEKGEYKKTLYGKQAGNCAGCNLHFHAQNLTLDRIVPGASGGTYRPGNLQLLCQSCNSIKGDQPHEFLMLRLHKLGYI